jgi:hypothetical protein
MEKEKALPSSPQPGFRPNAQMPDCGWGGNSILRLIGKTLLLTYNSASLLASDPATQTNLPVMRIELQMPSPAG